MDRCSILTEADNQTTAVDTSAGRAIIVSRRSPAKDPPNEDAAMVFEPVPGITILAVADGCGGYRAGEVASRTALQAFCSTIADAMAAAADADAALTGAILAGFDEANRAVAELRLGAATTLSVVEVRAGFIRPYHAGDSMILVTGQRGRIKLETVAHSPVAYAVEAGVLSLDEAMMHEDRHLITNLVGSGEMRVDVGPEVELSPRDTLILASDGLADNMYPHEVVEALRAGPLAAALQTLAEACTRRMQAGDADAGAEIPSHPDDLTIIAFRPG